MKTALITGCSSGFGREIAEHFLDRDWKVVATMRTPREGVIRASEHLRLVALDVTDPQSIRQAVEAAGPIDALVNNAGIGLMSALEGTPLATIRDIFEANTFGPMAMIQCVLPQFRARKAGVIVNVSSATTLKSLPLLSVYTASKAAVNGFTQSLALEMAPFNVRVGLVLPGRSPETRFSRAAQQRAQSLEGAIPDAYASFAESVIADLRQGSPLVTHAEDVAEAVWRMVNDAASPLHVPVGADAVALAEAL